MEFILYPWKNPVFKGGYKKTISWGDSLKRGAWTVWRFKGGIGKKEGDVVFKGGEGGWDPNVHYGNDVFMFPVSLR